MNRAIKAASFAAFVLSGFVGAIFCAFPFSAAVVFTAFIPDKQKRQEYFDILLDR